MFKTPRANGGKKTKKLKFICKFPPPFQESQENTSEWNESWENVFRFIDILDIYFYHL